MVFNVVNSICDWRGNCGKPQQIPNVFNLKQHGYETACYALQQPNISTYKEKTVDVLLEQKLNATNTPAPIQQTPNYSYNQTSLPPQQKNKLNNSICNGKQDSHYSKKNCQPTFLLCTAGIILNKKFNYVLK